MTDVRTSPSVLTNWQEDSDSLLISFGGLEATTKTPRNWFPFVASTTQYLVNKIYLKDDGNNFHHSGITGVSKNLDETAEYLKGIIDQRGIRRTVCLGVSGGGYAALLIGALIGAKSVFAISARTYLDLDNFKKYGDYRVLDKLDKLYEYHYAQEEYFDLEPVLTKYTEDTEYHLYYAINDRIDALNAKHVRSVPSVQLHKCEYGDAIGDHHKAAHILVAPHILKDEAFHGLLSRSLGVRA